MARTKKKIEKVEDVISSTPEKKVQRKVVKEETKTKKVTKSSSKTETIVADKQIKKSIEQPSVVGEVKSKVQKKSEPKKSSKKKFETISVSDGDKKTSKVHKTKKSSVEDRGVTVLTEENAEKSSKPRKKKITEEVQIPADQKKRTRKTKETTTDKKIEELKSVVTDNTTTKKTRKSKKDDNQKLSPVIPEKIEEPKEEKIVEELKKEWKPLVKTNDFYEFSEGKYVLGDVEELFDEAFTKKVKASVKKLSKKNHGKDDKLGIYYFKVNEKVWDLIEYNSKILTANKALILCKSELITKEGKLRFCRRFESREEFRVYPEYTKDDYCLFFYNIDSPSPFIMLQEEVPI